MKNRWSVLLFTCALFAGAFFSRPAYADCCIGPTPIYYTYDKSACLSALAPPGTWSKNHVPDAASGTCKPNTASESGIEALPGTDTIPQPRPPIIFIPNVAIPGLFEGPIVVGSETIGQYIAAFYMFFVSIVGILAVAMLLYGGYRRITAAGNSSKIQESDDIINNALSGVVLTMISYLLLNLINPTLTRLAGFELPEVQPILFKLEESAESVKGATASDVAYDSSTGKLLHFNNTAAYDDLLRDAADNAGIQRSLLKAIMLVESSGRPWVVSPAGACGLMQVMPANVGQSNCLGMIEQPIQPSDSMATINYKSSVFERNIRAGARVLADAIRKTCPSGVIKLTSKKTGQTYEYTCKPKETQCTNGDLRFAIAAYNGGITANCSSNSCSGETFWQCAKLSGYAETRLYVQKVITAQNQILENNWTPK